MGQARVESVRRESCRGAGEGRNPGRSSRRGRGGSGNTRRQEGAGKASRGNTGRSRETREHRETRDDRRDRGDFGAEENKRDEVSNSKNTRRVKVHWRAEGSCNHRDDTKRSGEFLTAGCSSYPVVW